MISDEKILASIRDYIDSHGFSPTVRELCKLTGIRSPGAMSYRLSELRFKGMLTYERYKPRTIRVVGHE